MWTDNGKPCPHCGGTCYKYEAVSGRRWSAACYTCRQKHYFLGLACGQDYAAAEVSAAHRAASEAQT
ncbi:MAG: hypothetical protein K6T65_01565 [Peptococcaceae bacterium]|nr:hypothetical protein [Peptococcaceae bacterium]